MPTALAIEVAPREQRSEQWDDPTAQFL